MSFTCTNIQLIERKVRYTKKQIDHFLEKITLTCSEWEEEIDSDKDLIEFDQFSFKADIILNGEKTLMRFAINRYSTFLKLRPDLIKLNSFDEEELEYSIYEYFYKNRLYRFKLFYKIGPKISFADFKKRNDLVRSFYE